MRVQTDPGIRRGIRLQSGQPRSTQIAPSHPPIRRSTTASPDPDTGPVRTVRSVAEGVHDMAPVNGLSPISDQRRPAQRCPHRGLRHGFRSAHRGHPPPPHHSRQAPKPTPAHARKRHFEPPWRARDRAIRRRSKGFPGPPIRPFKGHPRAARHHRKGGPRQELPGQKQKKATSAPLKKGFDEGSIVAVTGRCLPSF